MDTAQQILSLVDENKEKLTDDVYKELCDKLMELNKAPLKYVRMTGVKVQINETDDGEECDPYLGHRPSSIILQVVNEIQVRERMFLMDVCDFEKSQVTKNEYEMIKGEIEANGYHRVNESSTVSRGTAFLAFKIEPLK